MMKSNECRALDVKVLEVKNNSGAQSANRYVVSAHILSVYM